MESELKRYKDLLKTVSNSIKLMFLISAVLLIVLYFYFDEGNMQMIAIGFIVCIVFSFLLSGIKRVLINKCKKLSHLIDLEKRRKS